MAEPGPVRVGDPHECFRQDSTTSAAGCRGLVGILAISTAIGVLVAGFVVPFVLLGGVVTRAAADAIEELPQELTTAPLAQRTRVLDRNGNLFATFYRENRVSVGLEKMSPWLQTALLAVEDTDFYRHKGWDPEGTVRAFLSNTTNGDVVQGGSTITQQLVKMTLVQQATSREEQRAATEETYQRKFKELRYALAVESQHSKEWILERYLNLAYFGDGAYGAEAASQHYFSRPAEKLNLRQAALLAGLVKNPVGYDPTTYPERARTRRNVVLNRMVAVDALGAKRAKKVKSRNLGLKVNRLPNGCVSTAAPFFCQYVRSYLLEDRRLGKKRKDRQRLLTTGGLTIRTTFDPAIQRAADKAVRERINPRDNAVGGLAFVRPGSGAVPAIAQSRPMGTQKKQGQTFLNYAVPERYGDARGFQAGSTFKVFVLAAAVARGSRSTPRSRHHRRSASRWTVSVDVAGRLRSDSVWEPRNSTGSGTFDLFSGTRQSVNTFFAKLELRTGLCKPYRLAKKMGVELTDPDNQQVPSFTLGVVDTDPLTMAAAYATFAARGTYCEPRPVRVVRDRDREVLTRYKRDCDRVLKAPVADAVNAVLRGVQEPGGFGHSAGISLRQPSAGKTGTINNNRAVWFVGYTPNMAAASMIAGVNGRGHWLSLNGQTVGGSYISRASGSRHAGPIWGNAMQAIEGRLPDAEFTRPDPRRVEGRPVVVPDLRAMTVEQANNALSRRGLSGRLGTADSAELWADPSRPVVGSEPAAGEPARSGDEVRLLLADD